MSEPAAPVPAHLAPPAGSTPGAALEALVALMRILRSPTGCPWDREQTLDTLLPFVLEEAHEVVEAAERRDMDELKGEIGDLMFEGVFLSQLTSESGDFTITDALNDVRAKLVRRHPHVFAPDAAIAAAVTTPQAVLTQWDAIKVVERAEKGRERTSRIDGVPEGLPALLRAARISTKAAKVGFEWPTPEEVLEKIDEETAEVRAALAEGDAAHVAEEIGDLLFAVSNLARKLELDPEALLRAANRKFATRFRAMEVRLADAGTPVGSDAATLDVMEAAWQAGKAR
ncbi:MAG: nucleoside triphosphate pyrophosphohydrolase [Vicinamibacteraceae bacterium]